MMSGKMSESRFFMWRALFAIAHADEVVTAEERSFMNKALETEPFSEAQREILTYDMEQKQDIRILFDKITDQHDRSDFFKYARPLVWADGDYGSDEQSIILELSKIHVKSVDFETFTTSKDLKLEHESYRAPQKTKAAVKGSLWQRILKSFGL
ncbi:MAG: hypothetical protein JWO78_958 [Micavibrio sp.]|nr:hypothetical protein [Micavibrio sp.]